MLWSFQAVFLCKPGEGFSSPTRSPLRENSSSAANSPPPTPRRISADADCVFPGLQTWSTLSDLWRPAPWLQTRRCEARSLQVSERAPPSETAFVAVRGLTLCAHAAFPLFTVQMFHALGTQYALMLTGEAQKRCFGVHLSQVSDQFPSCVQHS